LTDANATYFGDYSRTGVNVITMPGIKIGAYSCVGAGIVVYEDVPSRTLRLAQAGDDRPRLGSRTIWLVTKKKSPGWWQAPGRDPDKSPTRPFAVELAE